MMSKNLGSSSFCTQSASLQLVGEVIHTTDNRQTDCYYEVHNFLAV